MNKEMNMYLYRFTLIFSSLGKNIADVTNVVIIDRLKIGDFIIDCVHYLWCAIYLIIGTLGDYIATCFNQISRIDFTKIIDVGGFETTLSTLTWILLGITIIVTLIVSMFKPNLDLEYIKWTIVTIFAISCLGEYNAWVRGYLDIGLEVIDETFEYDDLSLSEQIFYDNSYDMLKSLKTGELTLVNRRIPMNRIDINETMSKNDLQGIVRYDIGGNILYDDLSDGFMNSGLLEERYYRYSIDYGTMILTMLVCVIIYLIGMFKIAYVGFNWFYTDLYGGVIMAIGVSSANKVKFVYLSILKCLPSFLLTYVGVSIFRMMITSVLAMEIESLTKIVLLFIGGFMSILGSDAVTKGFGIDDGMMFMLKSFMLSRQMSKFGKGFNNMAHNVKDKFSNMGKGSHSGYDESSYNNSNTGEDNYGGDDESSHSNSNTGKENYGDDDESSHSNSNTGEKNYGGDDESSHSNSNTGKENYGGYDESSYNNSNTGEENYGGYHNHDTTDSNNERIKEKVDAKKARYAEGEKDEQAIPKCKAPLSNLPDETKQKEQIDEPVESPVQESARNIIPHEEIDMSNAERNEYGSLVPKGYDTKDYEEYKKDYDNGINNVYKKSLKSTYKPKTVSNEKQLPKWFYEQSNPEDEDEEERQQVLAELNALREKK